MFNRIMSAGFEDVKKTNNPAPNVNIRGINAVTNPKLGSEMNNLVELLDHKEFNNSSLVLYVHSDEAVTGILTAWEKCISLDILTSNP